MSTPVSKSQRRCIRSSTRCEIRPRRDECKLRSSTAHNVKLETLFTEATGVILTPLPENAIRFQLNANRFWHTITSIKE
jgi:hypothetical protein